jgi:hypothetical protein
MYKFLSYDFVCMFVRVYSTNQNTRVCSRKDWILSEISVTPPILPGNVPSCIFGKILFTTLVCCYFLDRLNPKILKRN